MYKIVWDLSEKRFTDLQRELKSGTYDYCDDYIGGIRVGECCFDVVLIIGETEYDFYNIDCYVYGIDSGYGIAKDGTPYDMYDGFCYNVNTNEDYETFKRNVDAKIAEFLDDAVDIIKDKAEKETLFW